MGLGIKARKSHAAPAGCRRRTTTRAGEQRGAMKIAVPKEKRPREARVAVSPDSVKKLIGLGATVTVEAGAGTAAAMLDPAYQAAGAEIAADIGPALAAADIVLKVQRPTADELARINPAATLCCLMAPHADRVMADAL